VTPIDLNRHWEFRSGLRPTLTDETGELRFMAMTENGVM
jgi:hypothetical protein